MVNIKFTVSIDGEAVLTDEFVQEMRESAKGPDATPFLLSIQRKYPEDNDAFCIELVKMAVRTGARTGILPVFREVGQGIHLAPHTVHLRYVEPLLQRYLIPFVFLISLVPQSLTLCTAWQPRSTGVLELSCVHA